MGRHGWNDELPVDPLLAVLISRVVLAVNKYLPRCYRGRTILRIVATTSDLGMAVSFLL